MRRFSPLASMFVGCVFAATVGMRLMTWSGPKSAEVDGAEAELGRQLFEHEWTTDDPLAGGGDGLGPVFNATSCVSCHNQSGPGGGGPIEFNVKTFTVRPTKLGEESREGVVHE